jgi:hypothetical protein
VTASLGISACSASTSSPSASALSQATAKAAVSFSLWPTRSAPKLTML